MFVNGHFSADLSDAESADPGVIVASLAGALERGDPAVLAAVSESDRARLQCAQRRLRWRTAA